MKDYITPEDFIFSLEEDQLAKLTKEKCATICKEINVKIQELVDDELRQRGLTS